MSGCVIFFVRLMIRYYTLVFRSPDEVRAVLISQNRSSATVQRQNDHVGIKPGNILSISVLLSQSLEFTTFFHLDKI